MYPMAGMQSPHVLLADGQVCRVSYYGHVLAVGEGYPLSCDAIESPGHAPGQERTAPPLLTGHP